MPDHPTNDLIFVSIAAYRDAQLVPTIRDCIAKARHPERLRFGICWQHGDEEQPLPFTGDERIRILDIDWRASRGACWARAEIMKLWQGEAWFMQVDSHCRFAASWDTKLIAAMEKTSSPRPILSTYASGFTPATPEKPRERLGGRPQLMAIQTFFPEGLPQLKPLDIFDLPQRTQPMRARFLAAGFLFTIGQFVEDVGYDPELYFFGEEIAITLRAFTHGYDLFHPLEIIVWHDYVRSYATRHWEDHTSASVTNTWEILDTPSRNKIKSLLAGERVESYGLGSLRSLEDYEAFAGISFRERKVQDYTRRALEPPNPPAPANWTEKIYTWLVRILIDPKQLPPASFDRPAFWYVTIHDEEGFEIYRRDFPGSELQIITGDEPKIALVCELQSGIIPFSWTVWPVDQDHGWLQKLKGVLEEGDYAIIKEDEEAVDPDQKK
jgi:hypothetical protein